jgi:thiol:disulfide interchange protein DsbD
MALIVVALAANLFGAFNVTVPKKVAELEAGRQKREGHVASAGMGLMMAVLATPCSFAFLVGALAWALGQPLWLGTIGIVFLGVGMAAPHVVLAAFPGLIKKLPRPGRWMELFKQSMAFLLLPLAVFLITTMPGVGDNDYAFWVGTFCVVLAMALWVWGTWVRHDAPLRRKLIVRGIALALVVAAGVWMLAPPAPTAVEFEPFDPGRIQPARRDGRPVVVKFTASWCVECKVVDRTVYADERVAEVLTRRNALVMKADATDNGSTAHRFLKRVGGNVPLTVVYPAGGGIGKRLPGLFSREDLVGALDSATGGG